MAKYAADKLQNIYQKMLRIRYFEEQVTELFMAGEIPGFVHVYTGEEAVGVGVCEYLTKEDYITSTHRGHGHCISKGAEVAPMMAEIFGKETGFCKGKGGSMHIADFSIGMMGANGVVGGGYNLAVGAALASKMQKNGRIAVCFFGDGASNRGTFHEGINMASAWKLPVIFVCENNEWASTTSTYPNTSAVADISDRAAGYGIPRRIADGNNVFEVMEAMEEAEKWVRSGNGPFFLEFKTYRVGGHFVGDPEMYRTREEVKERFTKNDPIKNFEERVLKEKWLTKKEMDRLKEETKKEIAEAVEQARKDPFPPESALWENVYAETEVAK